jgi:hypothetical protein
MRVRHPRRLSAVTAVERAYFDGAGRPVSGMVASEARELSTADDPGRAFFEFLGRIVVEVGMKRDLADADQRQCALTVVFDGLRSR